MIMALPIVGKILAGFAASGVEALASSATKTGQTRAPGGLTGAANPSDFAQALDALDQTASKAKHASIFSDKV